MSIKSLVQFHDHALLSIYLVSLTKFSVDGLFEAFSNCAELNPDPNAGMLLLLIVCIPLKLENVLFSCISLIVRE